MIKLSKLPALALAVALLSASAGARDMRTALNLIQLEFKAI